VALPPFASRDITTDFCNSSDDGIGILVMPGIYQQSTKKAALPPLIDSREAVQDPGAMTTAGSDWRPTQNLAGLPEGQVRSILGYAGESLVIGRALACGFNLFFKAWRDSKYDAVLDANGELFRIEIKQSGTGENLSCTSGGRSGAQISREAASREVVLSPEDSDFLVGVHTFTGNCWIVPTEVIYLRNRKTNPTWSLTAFEEKWAIFAKPPFGLTLEEVRIGFRGLSLVDLQKLSKKVGVVQKPGLLYRFSGRSQAVKLRSIEEWYILEIWNAIFNAL
jgi:hypothetical protein